MNKLMLVATIAISFAAQASDIARVQNSDGGQIVFTATKCPDGKTYVVYGYGTSSNDTIIGCHFWNDGAFWVSWKGKDSMSRYPASQLTWDKDFLEFLKQKNSKTY